MPITINYRQTIGETFRQLQNHDPNLSSASIQQTIEFCEKVFNDDKPIQELIAAGPINIGGIEWDFEFKNGIRSLVRRGFYKIITIPFERDILSYETGEYIPTWSANVLYSPNEGHSNYFKFLANVGPLVNVNGMGFNFTSYGGEILTSRNLPDSKEDFFRHMVNKVFYVSQQTYINRIEKQTVWFKFQ